MEVNVSQPLSIHRQMPMLLNPVSQHMRQPYQKISLSNTDSTDFNSLKFGDGNAKSIPRGDFVVLSNIPATGRLFDKVTAALDSLDISGRVLQYPIKLQLLEPEELQEAKVFSHNEPQVGYDLCSRTVTIPKLWASRASIQDVQHAISFGVAKAVQWDHEHCFRHFSESHKLGRSWDALVQHPENFGKQLKETYYWFVMTYLIQQALINASARNQLQSPASTYVQQFPDAFRKIQHYLADQRTAHRPV